MSRKNRQKNAFITYNRIYQYHIYHMLSLVCSSVCWQGLAPEIDLVRLEQCISRSGSGIIGYDSLLKRYIAGTNASVGLMDVYGYPMNRKLIAYNGQKMNFTPDTSVIIFDNSFRWTTWSVILKFADELADLDMTILRNCDVQRMVPIIPCTQSQRVTIENAMDQLQDGYPYIPVDSEIFDTDGFKNSFVFENAKSFVADRVLPVRNAKWNEFLTFAGINNAVTDKKERMITSEADSNMDEILIMRRARLNNRQRAADMMNRLWGWNVTVCYYSDLTEQGNDLVVDSANITGIRDQKEIFNTNTSGMEVEKNKI